MIYVESPELHKFEKMYDTWYLHTGLGKSLVNLK
jgi:hypothetical protein